jgi:uncharacterized repeat protein (TIGR01451 family)/fimbrial isopeptide formation D2 family protein
MLILIFVVALILVICVPTISDAARGTWRLGVVKVREGKDTQGGRAITVPSADGPFAFQAKNVNVLKIVERNNGVSNFEHAIYCLRAGIGFGQGGTSVDWSNAGETVYTEYYDMLTERTQVNSILGLTTSRYNSLLWLLDNVYLPKQMPVADRQAAKNALLTAAIEYDSGDGLLWGFEAVDVPDMYITDDVIEVAQQWAIWYFVNENLSNANIYHTSTLPTLQISRTGENSTYTAALEDMGTILDEWQSEPRTGRLQQEVAEVIYTYLVENALRNSTYNKEVATQINLNRSLSPELINSSALGTYSLIGPFEIQKTGNTTYSFTAKLEDAAGNRISETSYSIANANGNAITGVRTLAEAVGKVQFYIKLSKTVVPTIGKLKLSISYSTNATTATFWTVDGAEDVNQPVVVIERTPAEVEQEIEVPLLEYDLALRKFITKVNNVAVTSRAPVVNTAPLKNSMGTTAAYTHTKEPVTVCVGDIVTYTIRIYNEATTDAKVTLIEDYLPEELEFVANSSLNIANGWSATNSGRIVTTSKLNGTVIRAYNYGDTLNYVDVQIECRVKDTAVQDQILTNIAQINNDDGADRDSTVANVAKPATSALLSSYARQQEDDDDYEKVKVKVPEYDLALRKFITKINDVAVSTSREPVVNTSRLAAGTATTAEYTHPKTPLIVYAGDKVTYKIRVYNEAEVDGYVTLIEDYLPEELEFIADSSLNIANGWVASNTGRVITTNKLNQTVIEAYDKGSTLSYVEIEIECRVKDTVVADQILTNIAQINNDSGVDRDSTVANVVKPTTSALLSSYATHQEDDDDYEKVKVKVPEFDLALRKFITKVNDVAVSTSRAPVVDTSRLAEGSATTATYTHSKTPLVVYAGDKVTYKIRIYNEAEVDGYVTIIEDYLPEELEFIADSSLNIENGWIASSTGRIITTNKLNEVVIDAYDRGNTLSYIDIEVECRVKEDAEGGKILTNIAQINGDSGEDRDSSPANVEKPSTSALLSSYARNQEDDDDYEKIKVYEPSYDLALRKFITEVNGKTVTPNRAPVVDVTPLKNDTGTTARYTHPKDPVLVQNGDIVTYTIRVYNEGELDAYAEEIKDNIPEGLEFVIDNQTNIEYMWELSSDEKTVSTKYLSKGDSESPETENLLAGFDEDTMNALSYKDVKIAFKVVEPNSSSRIITNIAEIKEDDGDDIDSTPNNNVLTEDDIDVEHLKLQYFDLALRKFITKVEDSEGKALAIETDETKDVSRVPDVKVDSNGKITYTHPKNPVIVSTNDIVTYTIRVYNEGPVAGYAEEVKDDIPNGLEFVPDNSTNKEYGWVMYDKDGKVTTDVSKAKTIKTAQLSSANSENNIIPGFNRETMELPAYKEVKVAFKVVEKNLGESRIVINTAEISKDSDDDIDSVPDNDKPGEDDIDKEYIRVKYFDLALLKWVSKAIVTQSGETRTITTGYNGYEDPEPVVKVEIIESQIKKAIVKFEYTIKITNEGEKEGYALEVADYIPEGLEFVAADNPKWTLKEDGKIVTDQLKDTLLKPGESATVTVMFKWINGKDNLGLKTNVAEISKDSDDDIDSTPDNKKDGEDDIDEALVILSVKTGVEAVYIVLPTIIIGMLGAGILLIKKYVL